MVPTWIEKPGKIEGHFSVWGKVRQFYTKYWKNQGNCESKGGNHGNWIVKYLLKSTGKAGKNNGNVWTFGN